MTKIELSPSFKTVSGKPLLLGTGTGTKWKDLVRADASNSKILVDQLKLSVHKGYYHLDTAEIYGTQPEVGKALKEIDVNREDLWVTTKYSPFSKFGPVAALKAGFEEIGVDYVDLYLIHANKWDGKNGYNLESAWKEVIETKKQGLARYIGVSNFDVPALEAVIAISKEYGDEYLPQFNQIEFHPYLKNQFPGLYDFCQKNSILIEAYGPLTPLIRVEEKDHPLAKILPRLSEKYGKTDSQILLRWVLQKNVLPVTTSSNEKRIEQSLEVYDFSLTEDDVKEIDSVEDEFQFRGFTFVL
ncbi:aldo/keto reductase [Yamadazyma tenuis]|uniref:NADP-dependent oxidoreductase domain-containing protein n=1 Tax=Candida tenuis (strain ATCC 10573 / BCRC 21748 / CBS 615 / JCM 9827 / NBRC 10315 / NRRL Y-1498 / VKM Y-70) TaxID=590646 RepID=G3BE57_CANTC|nr:uncharacterized protein CANTEDRAFT_111891 [Yamadazyma tenuis ATCC 10573]EGV60461.1 hypothetical protein CANTEDRAFT_111891 [Yamadazyma tenuis ATCC 10573]WEJ94296.1 aldo/keto reductase [Yamadazyma tenuis]